jgi:hypothetical protein
MTSCALQEQEEQVDKTYINVIKADDRKLFIFFPVSSTCFAYYSLLQKFYEVVSVMLAPQDLSDEVIKQLIYVYGGVYFTISFIFVPLYQNITFGVTSKSEDTYESSRLALTKLLCCRCSPRYRSDQSSESTRFFPFSTYNYFVMITQPGKFSRIFTLIMSLPRLLSYGI